MKTVAIVGAGPSGLVTAKTLLRSKSCKYRITIFEKTSEVGGLWAVHKDKPYNGMLNPEMPTNLSRFNIGFSDLAWSSIGLEGHVPYWPRAWQVGQYLRAYASRYIPSESFRFNTVVTNATAVEKNGLDSRWKLRWHGADGGASGADDISEGFFDYLVTASGFFGATSLPVSAQVEGLNIKVTHSTKLRKLQDVAPDDPGVNGTLLVVGGGMSGADAVTLLASQLSDAMYSSSGNTSHYSKLRLVQLCPEPAYALPLAAACDKDEPAAPHFIPLDLLMYDLGKRPPGPVEMGVGQWPADRIRSVHNAFQELVGDQSDLGTLNLTYSDESRAAYVTLTEQYSNFIRAGKINILTARLLHLQQVPNAQNWDKHHVKASYVDSKGPGTLDDVVGLVYATGFTPQPSLNFLDPEIRQALEHDVNHNRLPILLDEHATLDSRTPGLAVVGFHEGAFWGSIEMEARLIEARWSRGTNQNRIIHSTDDKIKKLQSLREAMTRKSADVPQYWMGDYVGLMETIAREVDLSRNDLDFSKPRSGPITVARYTDSTCDQDEADKTLAEYRQLIDASRTGTMFVSRASFLALQGDWTMHRNITSHLPTMPSGTLTGTSSFHTRLPTNPSYDFEYLYIENGTFTMSNGLTMSATRRYVYRYEEPTDKITVWFVKDDGKTVDYMYHGLAFDANSRKNGWLAKADHLCIKDMYRSDYTFRFKGNNLQTLGVVHAVKGPKKDYVSETWYSR